MDEEKAMKMVAQAALVSQKVREALQASLPVATEQLMTVQIPGTIIDTSDPGPYVWDSKQESDTPHRIKVNESRLVDNMVPLSKVMMGVTGKSVARSYAAALDMLIPEDAPIDTDKSTTTKTAAADRYIAAMKYLTQNAPNSSRSVIDVYVEKQQAYSEAMNKWEAAKAKARSDAKERFPGNVREQQRFYDDWNQESFRNFKNNAQAKYMDWIVNGNKLTTTLVLSVSSAMKRVESSKEAARNLVVIDPDGSTEWQEVHLTPANWATLCKEKVDQWQGQNNKLSRKDFESEIKRLKRLLLSYNGLMNSIQPSDSTAKPATGGEPEGSGADQPSADGNEADKNNTATNGDSKAVKKLTLVETEDKLTKAYKNLYDAQNAIPPNPLETRARQEDLQVALENNSKANLENNKDIASNLSNKSKNEKLEWIKGMIGDVNSQIKLLEQGLEAFYKASAAAPAITEVVKKDVKDPGQDKGGQIVSTQYAEADGQYADPKFNLPRNGVAVPQPNKVEPSKWTKISLSISASSQSSSTESLSSSTSASASASGWMWNASASFNHSQASMNASNATSNCSVDIKFEALLVTIDRAWLHGELFSDPELNTGDDVKLSPGALDLHKLIDQKNDKALANYPYFPSYPTAFIVASNVELEFRGDTTELEEAVESSHTDAQVKVGYGPFSLSASHSQDKSSAKTKMETTATGTRITLEAPAIIGWVSQLVPQLPRPKGGSSLVGPMV
ncbi:Phage tail fiber repeat 2 [Fusarium beomiforme]|uniref:Phage tail fiber repeat 2 n=1 Tax=Fusarium beomiforme TaxID=44412 RepID=A0A9P5AIJ9_9HYPO|nr:Phage tail fiber repeat 2 [Fusarium beomiforme]